MARRKEKARSGGRRDAGSQRSWADWPTAALDGTGHATKTTPTVAFTLQDEARNTAHNQTTWGLDAKLRGRPVIFISGGLVEPSEDVKDILKASPGVSEGQSNGSSAIQQVARHMESSQLLASIQPQALKRPHVDVSPSSNSPPLAHPVDEHDPHFLASSETSLVITVDSTVDTADLPNSDDEDVILFKGRGSLCKVFSEAGAAEQNPIPLCLQSLQDTDSAMESDATLADYVNNIDGDSDGVRRLAGLNSRELGGSDNEFIPGAQTQDTNTKGRRNDAATTSVTSCTILASSSGQIIKGAARRDATLAEDAQQLSDEVDEQNHAQLVEKQNEHELQDDEPTSLKRNGPQTTMPRNLQNTRSAPANVRRRMTPQLGAAAMADAFDELDLLDWSRPSLQRRKKGNKSGLPSFDLSDSELEASLAAVWQKDRLRKKEKKQVREELRTKGLLRKNASPDDPRVKYADGMNLSHFKVELKAFLLSSDERLGLAPMDATSRKLVHELANRFKVKSKSSGSGDQRYPVLYRTKATLRYVAQDFEAAFARVGRRHFPRRDVRTGRQSGTDERSGHAASVRVQDGEVVGGSAPEIAPTNKGRAMLVKMGWSRGTALGAMDNKGIMQPIEHVVKRSRTGLG